MKKITLKDIARELNVTVGTVSHVFNGRDDISEEMRTKVLETAKKMGYISNNAAASLRLGKTKTVAIIVPDISNPHIAYQIKLIEDILLLYLIQTKATKRNIRQSLPLAADRWTEYFSVLHSIPRKTLHFSTIWKFPICLSDEALNPLMRIMFTPMTKRADILRANIL